MAAASARSWRYGHLQLSIPGKIWARTAEGAARLPPITKVTRRPSACYGTGGKSRMYHHDLRGFNYRLEGMQGAILGVKLKHLDAWTDACRAHAAALHGTSERGRRQRHPLWR